VTPVVLKLGGELLEDSSHLRTVVSAIAAATGRSTPLVVVHGGGREIDAALKAAGIGKRQVDGLRITDEATLEVVVSVLAGVVNTRLVAALVTSGVPAVGLTGADARCGLSRRAPFHHSVDGGTVDLGLVGLPVDHAEAGVLETMIDRGFVPVVASIGVDSEGQLLNINADTFAGHLAARLKARRLIIAGTTAGVLRDDGATIPRLEASAIAALVTKRTATAGMIAKLRACEQAVANGVDDAVIVDGRDRTAIDSAVSGTVPANATRVAAAAQLVD
jgi:acetylglutamate kinase